MNRKNLIVTAALFLIVSFSMQAQHIKEYKPMFKSDFNSSDFGQGTSIGFTLFGDGFFGFMLRKTLRHQHQIGVSANLLPALEFDTNANEIRRFRPGFLIRPEFNFHLGSNFKEKAKKDYVKRKYKKHYLSIKPGVGLTFDKISTLAISWHRERFNVLDKNYSHGLDIGLQYRRFENTSGVNRIEQITIFFRLDFNWYKQRKFL